MKYGTLIFTRTVNLLFSGKMIDQRRRNLLLETWEDSLKKKDKLMLTTLIEEVKTMASQRDINELNKVLELIGTY